jgi:hypothetical protein
MRFSFPETSVPAPESTQPPIHSVVTGGGGGFQGVERSVREAGSPPLSVQLRMCGAINLLPHTPPWRVSSLRTGTYF